ncbi:hypothetical protein [Streptomyces sp. Je 1-369]|nr:hypothetical protein [Streptomyces sp. Je 1-369]WAL98383.1 hypothetical protein NOO62_30205 [Streptomyces sp. Je 1-369]
MSSKVSDHVLRRPADVQELKAKVQETLPGRGPGGDARTGRGSDDT